MLNSKFMGSSDNYMEADIIIVGAPMDYTSSFRPGSRYGPQKIREVSIGIEEYNILLDRSLEDVKYYDAGDIELPFANVKKSLEMIGDTCKNLINDNKFPLFIGGEHLISLPLIKEVYKKYGDDLIVLHFDAHADLRESYLGEDLSHATVIRRISDFVKTENIFQFGIRSGTKEEIEYARLNTNVFLFDSLEPFKKIINRIIDKPVYITLDIDILDPAYANGTGTPEPGGCTSKEILEIIYESRRLNIVGFDIVEVNPIYDASERTSLLAAKIIRDTILGL